jgi:Holliday junction resolvase RusA-like endonuclease
MNDAKRIYIIPFSPVGVNHAYSTRIVRKGKSHIPIRYMQPNYKEFKAAVKFWLEKTDTLSGGRLPFGPPFSIHYLFLMEKSSFFYKKGTLKRRDVSNYFKLLEDACSEYWEVDDTHNLVVIGQKRWVPDGELKEFIEDAYKDPPHKDLRAIIKIGVQKLPETYGEWDGRIDPGVSLKE